MGMVQKMHGPKNSARADFNLARTQYYLHADLVNKTKNTVGTEAQRIRHERTHSRNWSCEEIRNEIEVRPSVSQSVNLQCDIDA